MRLVLFGVFKKMYAYIVESLWEKYPNKDYAEFLRLVGTPAIVTDPMGIFNTVSGFYVLVEPGWYVRFRSELMQMEELDLSLYALSLG
jgi:hypothetical protein